MPLLLPARLAANAAVCKPVGLHRSHSHTLLMPDHDSVHGIPPRSAQSASKVIRWGMPVPTGGSREPTHGIPRAHQPITPLTFRYGSVLS